MSEGTWTMWLLHGAVRGADDGSKQLSPMTAEKLYREYKQKRGEPSQFVYSMPSGKQVTVNVKEGKCPFPLPGHEASSGSENKSQTRFHDDKSTYTGVYKAGGPTNVDHNPGSLSGVVDRRVSNDVRGAVR